MEGLHDCCSGGSGHDDVDPYWEERDKLTKDIVNNAADLESLSEKVGRKTTWDLEILRISSSLSPEIRNCVEQTYHSVYLTKLFNDMNTLRSLHEKIQEETNKLYEETRSPFDCCRH